MIVKYSADQNVQNEYDLKESLHGNFLFHRQFWIDCSSLRIKISLKFWAEFRQNCMSNVKFMHQYSLAIIIIISIITKIKQTFIIHSKIRSQNIRKQNVNIADETYTDYSFLNR